MLPTPSTESPIVYKLDSRGSTLAMIPALVIFTCAIPMGILMFRESLSSGHELFKGLFVLLFSPFVICVIVYLWFMRRGATLVIDGDMLRHVNGKGETIFEAKAADAISLQPFKGFLQMKVNAYLINFPNNRRIMFDRHTVGLESLILLIEQRTGKSFSIK